MCYSINPGFKSLDFFWISFGFLLDNAKLQQIKGLYHFSQFRLDAAERRLWRDDDPVSLTPKQFDLLFYFVANAGRVSKKNDLLDAVWTDTYIEETTLARNVSWLRTKLAEGANGEQLIETVPKLGYRFTAEVTRSANDENTLIVEEQIVQHFRGEEIITTDNVQAESKSVAEIKLETETENTNLLTPNAAAPPRRLISASLFLLVALAVSGFILYHNNLKTDAQLTGIDTNEKATVKNITVDATSEKAQIKIGSIVNLQNQSSNEAGYLDAWGQVTNKPEFWQVPTETMFVSTHKNPNRDNGSGSWKIVSANGKSDGEPLAVGDRIHLKNMYPNAGYLDACGWIEHLRFFYNYSDQSAAVFTTISADRDNGSGTWTIKSATEADRSPVLEGDSIALESNLNIDDKGKVHIAGFLNVAGNVKDIPSFNDYDGASLVFTQKISNDQPVIDIWTITISKAK